jgi:hypothetical protein
MIESTRKHMLFVFQVNHEPVRAEVASAQVFQALYLGFQSLKLQALVANFEAQ